MKQVTRRMAAADVPALCALFLEDGLPYDITVRRGRHQGERQLVITIKGTTQEDIAAKCDALERTIARLKA